MARILMDIRLRELGNPIYFIVFFGIVLILFIVNGIFQRDFLYKKIAIMYEEEKEAVMVTLVAYDPL